jgi:dihydrofolate reductase
MLMRRIFYRVAASLDGYIEGPRGEIDWIAQDPAVSLASLYAGFDTALLGRRTYELTLQPGAPAFPRDWHVYVFSRTLPAAQHSSVTVISNDVGAAVATLRSRPGGDIWLFGGASLFASLLALNAVDRVELAIMPVLLGGGTPFLGTGAARTRLKLVHSETRPNGIVHLHYDIQRPAQ